MWMNIQSPVSTTSVLEHAEVDRALRADHVDERELPAVAVEDPHDLTRDAEAHVRLPPLCASNARTAAIARGTAAATGSDNPMPSSTVAGRQPTT